MIRRKKENIEWLEFEQLQKFPEVVHGVILRHGGVSTGPFDSLNIGGGTNDDPNAIQKNREIVANLFKLPNLFGSIQVHGNWIQTIHCIDKAISKECDGMMTQVRNLGLLIKHADCQAAIFYDPAKKVIGNIHCGWRGSVGNIYAKAVEKMKTDFASNPADIRVCISPSLGPERAEFINYKTELPEEFYPFQMRPNHFDFWAISKMQLLASGILEKHIEIAYLCTYLEEKDFFSYRREKKTGRNGTIVALKPM